MDGLRLALRRLASTPCFLNVLPKLSHAHLLVFKINVKFMHKMNNTRNTETNHKSTLCHAYEVYAGTIATRSLSWGDMVGLNHEAKACPLSQMPEPLIFVFCPTFEASRTAPCHLLHWLCATWAVRPGRNVLDHSVGKTKWVTVDGQGRISKIISKQINMPNSTPNDVTKVVRV